MELKNVTKEQMENVLKSCKSLREVILSFNLCANGSGGYRNIKDKILNLGLEVPKYHYYGIGHSTRKYTNNDIFVEKSTFSRQHLKERVIKEKLIKYECIMCGNDGNWNGFELSLHLDHKNGINDDNRIENLRFLCPNCHAQTETYAGKANKK